MITLKEAKKLVSIKGHTAKEFLAEIESFILSNIMMNCKYINYNIDTDSPEILEVVIKTLKKNGFQVEKLCPDSKEYYKNFYKIYGW